MEGVSDLLRLLIFMRRLNDILQFIKYTGYKTAKADLLAPIRILACSKLSCSDLEEFSVWYGSIGRSSICLLSPAVVGHLGQGCGRASYLCRALGSRVKNNCKNSKETLIPISPLVGGPSSLAPSLSSSMCPYWPVEVVLEDWQGCRSAVRASGKGIPLLAVQQ